MPNHPDEAELRFLIPKALWHRLHLLLALTGEPRRAWCRRTVIEAIERELARYPVHTVWVRPGSVVYSREGPGVYVPIARVRGGERAWPLEVVSDFPTSESPDRLAWRVDVTSGPGGYEGRDVFLRITDVVRQQPPTPPPAA